MGFIPRRRIKENLREVDVFIDDTENRFINVQDVPETFVQGRSAFKLFGSEFLKPNVPIKIEILDKSGNTVFTQPVIYGQEISPKLAYRYISVEVYPPPINVPGEAELIILAELDETRVAVDPEFVGTYNVRYRKTINIDTEKIINEQPILFYKKPQVIATEFVNAQKKTNPPANRFISGSQIYGIVNDSLFGTEFVSGSDTQTTAEDKSETPSGDLTAQANLWKYKTGLYKQNKVLKRRGLKQEKKSPEPPQMTIYSNESKFLTKMVGSSFSITDIKITTGSAMRLIGDDGLDTEELYNGFVFPNFETKVESVVSDTELTLNKPYSVEYTNPTTDIKNRYYAHIGASNDPDQGDLLANFTASYVDWEVPSTSSYRFDSFVDFTVEDMRTFSGDVYRVKISGGSDSSQGDFPVLLDTVVDAPELLIDSISPSGVLRSGYFIDQDHIDKYWNTAGGNNNANQLTAYYTMSLSDAVYLSGSYETFNQVGRFELDSTYAFAVKKDVSYTLSFRALAKKSTKNDMDGNPYQSAKMFMHLSGSELKDSSDLQIQHSSSFGHTITNEFGQPVGLQIEDDELSDGYKDFGIVSHTFNPNFKLDRIKNTDTTLQIRIHSGEWVFSDISIVPASSTGFSPDEFKFRVPIPSNTLRPDNYDFLIEYLDINGNTAETLTFLDNIAISGSALIMEGSDNLMTGSMFMGNTQGEGIEMAGANSAFVRSVGFEGFTSASAGGKGGFMIWSGSVLPDSPDGYTGAGLEIHDGVTGDGESFFKFRTIDADNDYSSSFAVKTSRFFLGSVTDGNFVSGALGNIEISSSKFHLQADGDVITNDITASNINASGKIVAESGTIGGFNIGTDLTNSAGSTLNLKGGTGQITASAAQITGKITAETGQIAGFTIDGTKLKQGTSFEFDGASDADFFISSSKFQVDTLGNLTGSQVLISGGTITDGVTILGDVTANAIRTPASIGGSAATAANASSSIDSQGFAAFRSASIGGFVVDDVQIKSSNDNLILKDSGQITGSTVLFTGGKIADFTIDGSKLKQGTSFEFDGASDADFFISSSNFQVDTLGNLTGSQVLLSGGTITDGVTILGTVTANTILTPSTIAGSPATITNASSSIDAKGFAKFVSASIGGFEVSTNQINSANDNLLLKDSGQITGSTVLFSGGTVGGFELAASQINSTNDNLILKSSGQITGSTVLFTGGKIGGFTIDADEIKSTNLLLDSNNEKITVGSANAVTIQGGGTDNFITMGKTTFGQTTTVGAILGMDATVPTLELFKDANNKFIFNNSGVDIKAATFNLATTTLVIDSATNNGKIALGSIPPTSVSSSKGFYVDGQGNFLAGSGSGERISYDVANSELIMSSSKFFLGGANSFVSGAEGNIQIKSENFDLDTTTLIIDSSTNNGSIRLGSSGGPNAVDAATVGIYMDGNGDFQIFGDADNFFRFDVSDKLQIKAETFDLDAGKLILDSATNNGKIALGATPPTSIITNSGFYADGNGDVLIGDAGGARITFDKSTETFVVSSSNFLLGGNESFVSGSGGDLEISSSNFHVSGGNVVMSGKVTATSGQIAGFTIDGNNLTATNFALEASNKKISLGTGNTIFIADADDGIQLGHATFASAPFSVTKAGVLKATSGTIGGFTLSSTQISSENLIMSSTGTLETADFASNAKGWRISSLGNGQAEFENVRIRGTLSTAVFEKETVNAVGGQLYVANSTALTGSGLISASYTTMSVVNSSGFTGSYGGDGEILSLKKVTSTGFSTEYVFVQSASRDLPSSDTNFAGQLYVIRGYSGSAGVPVEDSGSIGETAGSAQSYDPGQVIVSTGRVNTGYIRLNANPNDFTTPYIDIAERTGSAVYDVDLKVRLGDLSGLSAARVGASPGFGLFTEKAFLTNEVTVGTLATEHIVIDATSLLFKDGSTTMAELRGTTWTLGGAHGSTDDAIVMSPDNGVTIFDSSTDKIVIDSDGVSITENNQLRAIFGATTVLGSAGAAVTTSSTDDCIRIADGTISIFQDNNNKAIINSSGMALHQGGGVRAIFGATSVIGSSGGSITATSTDNCVRITNTDAFIFESVNNFVQLNSSALTIVKGGHTSASFGTVTTIGSTTGSHVELSGSGVTIFNSSDDFLNLNSTDIKIVKGGEISASFGTTTTIGPTGGSHVAIEAKDIKIKDSTTEFVQIDSTALSIVKGGHTSASFGTKTTIGPTSGSHVEISGSGISVYSSDDDYMNLNSTDIVIVKGGEISASFGAKTTIGPTGGSHVELSGSGVSIFGTSNEFVNINSTDINIVKGGEVSASFGASTTIGPAGGAHVEISGSGVTVFGTDKTDNVNIGAGHLSMVANDAKVLDIVDGKINVGPGAVGGTAVTGNVRVEAGNVYLYGDATNTFSQMSSAGFEVTEDGVKKAIFGAISVIGSDGGGVTTTSTDDCIRITSDDIKLFESSTDFMQLDSTAMSIVKGGHVSASFGTKTTIGPTSGSHVEISGSGVTIFSDDKTDNLNIGPGHLAMTANNAKVLDIVDGKINIGPAAVGGTAVTGNVRVEAGNIYLYGNATNTFTQISSAGMETTLAGTKTAIFGSTSVIGSGTAVTTTSTDDCIRIAAGTISIFEDNNNKVVLNSGTLTFTSAGSVNAIFGATTVLGSDGAAVTTTSTDDCIRISDGVISIFESSTDFLQINSTALNIVNGGHVSASFGAVTTIGPTSGSHVAVSGSHVTVFGTHNNDTSGSFAKISADGLDIFKGGFVSSSFGDITTIGPTGSAHVEISGSGVTVFSTDKTDSINISNGGIFVKENSQVRAIFGSTTVLGSAGAEVATDSTDDCIRIANGTVSIFQDNNNKAIIDSDGLTVTQGGNQVGLFAATTKIGNTSNEHIQISGSGLELLDGSTQRFAINSSGVAIGDNFGVDGSGNVTMAGNVTAAAGTIGGFTLASTTLTSATTTSNLTNTLKITAGASSQLQFKGDDTGTKKRTAIEMTNGSGFFTDRRRFFPNTDDFTKFMEIRIAAGTNQGIPAGKQPAADGVSQMWMYSSFGEEPITVASSSGGGSPVQAGLFPFSESIQILNASGSQTSQDKGLTFRYLVNHPQGAGEIGIDQNAFDEVLRIGKVTDTGGDFNTGAAGNNREFHYGISGSSATTASFGSVFANYLNGDGSNITGLSSAAISSYTNSTNNRIITSVDASTVNGEANLTFDGSTLTVTGDISVTDDLFVGGGLIDLKNDGSFVSQIKFYCESSNAHAQTLIGAPHAQSATNTLTLPDGSDGVLVSTVSTATLTNKTLTSPDINTPDIDGGTIDNTPIGGSTPAAGAFTTVTTSDVVLSVTGTENAPAFQLGSANDGFYHLASGDAGINVLVNNVQEFLFADGGGFHADADITAFSTTVASDKRLKTNVQSISGSLYKLKKLRPVEFDWLVDRDTHEYGLIAQEVEKVVPEIVIENKAIGDTKKFLNDLDGTETFKTVDYSKINVLLIDAIKEQQEQIDELRKEIEELKNGSTN